MRILIVPSWFPSTERPLAGIFFYEQAELLARRNPEIEVHVFATPGQRIQVSPRNPLHALANLRRWLGTKRPQTEHLERNFLIHRFEGVQFSRHVLGGGLASEARRMQRMAHEIERTNGPIDVVHAHVCFPGGWLAVRLAQSLGCPMVLSEHMSPFPFEDLLDSRGRLLAEASEAFQQANLITGVSDAHARTIAAMVERQVITVPNFIDESVFFPGTLPSRPRLISVGHLVPQKGFDVLLRALAQCNDGGVPIELTIVGDGPERTSLERLSGTLRVAELVTFAGACSRDDLPHMLRTASGFVLASRHESFGVVVIEAMATGLPSLVTACGGPEEIVEEMTGFVVPSENVAALAAGLRHLVSARWNTEVIRARFLEKFSSAAVSSRWANLYRQAVAEYRAP